LYKQIREKTSVNAEIWRFWAFDSPIWGIIGIAQAAVPAAIATGHLRRTPYGRGAGSWTVRELFRLPIVYFPMRKFFNKELIQ
jgi:hypothetical protein